MIDSAQADLEAPTSESAGHYVQVMAEIMASYDQSSWS